MAGVAIKGSRSTFPINHAVDHVVFGDIERRVDAGLVQERILDDVFEPMFDEKNTLPPPSIQLIKNVLG